MNSFLFNFAENLQKGIEMRILIVTLLSAIIIIKLSAEVRHTHCIDGVEYFVTASGGITAHLHSDGKPFTCTTTE